VGCRIWVFCFSFCSVSVWLMFWFIFSFLVFESSSRRRSSRRLAATYTQRRRHEIIMQATCVVRSTPTWPRRKRDSITPGGTPQASVRVFAWRTGLPPPGGRQEKLENHFATRRFFSSHRAIGQHAAVRVLARSHGVFTVRRQSHGISSAWNPAPVHTNDLERLGGPNRQLPLRRIQS